MIRIFTPSIILFTTLLTQHLHGVEVTLNTDDTSSLSITATVANHEIVFGEVKNNLKTYRTITFEEGLNLNYIGHPDIPRVHRLVAVDPNKRYSVKSIRVSGLRVYKNVRLHPKQPDRLEDLPKPPFAFDRKAYRRPYGLGFVELGEKANLGPVSTLPITIKPVQYFPRSKELHIYTRIQFEVISNDKGAGSLLTGDTELSNFHVEQARSLLLNGERIAQLKSRPGTGTLLIITNETLVPHAKVLGGLYEQNNFAVQYMLVNDSTSKGLRERIEDVYKSTQLAGVVLFGDESIVPLHYWTKSLPGDSYYSFVSGKDYLADFPLGRLPVSNGSEAGILVGKIRRYYEIKASGYVNKKIMLLAHKEQYPNKYTANQEQIRRASNPQMFDFTTHYGGAGSRNLDVLTDTPNGYSIINYRGHGSDTSWSNWDAQSRSFATDEIQNLQNYDENMAVFFNIACNNGAIHKSRPSMAETLLLYASAENPNHGAVAVLAATIPSYTSTNHKFDVNLFKYLQTSADISIGNINALANNKLVIDNGMSPPKNIKMYILFGDPMLRPWIQVDPK